MSDNPVSRPTPRFRRVRVPGHPSHTQFQAGHPNVQAVIDELEDNERIVSIYPVSSQRLRDSSENLIYVPVLEALVETVPPQSHHHYSTEEHHYHPTVVIDDREPQQ